MKSFSIIILLSIFFLFNSCQPEKIEISTVFDHGSMGEWSELEPGYIQGATKHWSKSDGIGDQYYWFYFQADHVKGREITFELNDLYGVYRGNPHIVYTEYTQPVFSYDRENWERIKDVSYDSASYTFVFKQKFTQAPVWIAYSQPYTYTRYLDLMEALENSEKLNIENLTKTIEGRAVKMISLTGDDEPDSMKKTILIMAIQHAGEDAGGFYVEGILNFLVSDDPKAVEARKRFNWKIIPMMNPDGIYNGITRYNVNMEDLNNIWLDDDRSQPPVTGVKGWVENWESEGNKIDLFLDVHNHTQFHKYHVFILQDHYLDSLHAVMQDRWPVRIWHSEFEGSSCAWFSKKGIPSATLELSQSCLEDGQYIAIEDYWRYGKETVKGLMEYYGEKD